MILFFFINHLLFINFSEKPATFQVGNDVGNDVYNDDHTGTHIRTCSL